MTTASLKRRRLELNMHEGWSAFAVLGTAAVTQEQRGEDEVVVARSLLRFRAVPPPALPGTAHS